LGQGWRSAGEELDEHELAGRAGPFGLSALPDEVLAITAGADVQHDRVEVTFVGWSQEETAFVLGHTVVWGSYDEDSTWAEVDEVLKTRWKHPLGGALGLDATVIDAGDGSTMETVLSFCAPRSGRKVLAGKGVAGTRPFIEPSRNKAGRARLWLVGVDGIKAAIVSRLARGATIRFSADLPPVWYEQLASERLVTRYTRGQPQRRFERVPGRRAEALDCTVYAFAARQVVNVQWASRADALRRGMEDARPKPQGVIRSAWMER